MEKVKSFIIFILTIALFTTYFMIYNLWMDNRKLNKTINDLESTVRVYQIIEKTGKNGG
nr:MAG TPA: Septum formation initiator [Caudoviricetes sp.]